MVTQQLINYIKLQLQRGVPLKDIKRSLLANNWTEADINQAFNSLIGPINIATSAVPDYNQTTGLTTKPIGVRIIAILYILEASYYLALSALAFFLAIRFQKLNPLATIW